MAAAKFSSKSPTIRRIMKEAQELSSNPSAEYTAAPLESDLFEWHFTFRGPPTSVYSDGIYHGRIVLPPTYPLRPPSFRFMTPSGRFEVNREICLSISGHHEETWQPAWGVRTALVALRSFMETDPRGQLGGLDTTDAVRKRMATESHRFRCPACGKTNKDMITECAEAAAEAVAAVGSEAKVDVEIPTNLKMGWKDEMAPPPAPGAAASETPRALEAATDTPSLGGGVENLSVTAITTPPSPSPLPRPNTLAVALGPAPGPAPIRGPQHQGRPVATAAVPRWLDQLILALVVVLAALILNRVLGA